MAIVTTEEAERVMKRCQRGTVGYNEANELHADCYGTIGALLNERDLLRGSLKGVPEAMADVLEAVFALGQVYWQQADSDFFSQQKKADATLKKFRETVEKTKITLSKIGEEA